MSAKGAEVWRLATDMLERIDMSPGALYQRFINIKQPVGSHLSTNSAKKRKNVQCNRYSNILPFDRNCVKVHTNEPEGGRGRYINASMIKVSARTCCSARCRL
jgi:protein tyrosine phosphatase